MGWIVKLLMSIAGAVQDPKTGNVALSRTTGATLLTIGTTQLLNTTTMPEVAAGGVVIAAGTALIIARTKSAH